jgi:PTS system ascorbate-specific IIA component
LIIAHAPLAKALKECAMHVYPECADEVIAIDVMAHDSPEHTLEMAKHALEKTKKNDDHTGLLVLTDIFGATPANVGQRLVEHNDARMIAGVNLPMLYRSVCYRHESLETLVARALVGGNQGVMQVALPVVQE